MKSEGASNEEIAVAIGSTAASVRNHLARLGVNKGRTDNGYMGAFVGADIEERIKVEAAKRRKSAATLVRDLLKAIAISDLFNAVLEE